MTRLLISGIAVFLLVSMGYSEFRVDLEDVRLPHVVPPLRDYNVLPEAFLSYISPAKDISFANTEIVAYALKYTHNAFPPQLHEESIILFSVSENQSNEKWALGLLDRLTTAARWRASSYYSPYLAWHKTFNERPSVAEVATFIKSTNFGHNDFLKREVLKVVLYIDDSTLMEALSSPVSDEEKDLRKQISNEIEWGGPAPTWVADLVGNTYHYSKGLADTKTDDKRGVEEKMGSSSANGVIH
jgi:hypothetical protein